AVFPPVRFFYSVGQIALTQKKKRPGLRHTLAFPLPFVIFRFPTKSSLSLAIMLGKKLLGRSLTFQVGISGFFFHLRSFDDIIYYQQVLKKRESERERHYTATK
ncbi:MAG: hypothetical protein ACTSPG_06905, partial [Candidatus Hodarchaeales archaeon]